MLPNRTMMPIRNSYTGLNVSVEVPYWEALIKTTMGTLNRSRFQRYRVMERKRTSKDRPAKPWKFAFSEQSL
ncbi:MAG: hypothetical protein JNL58_30905 [Planctomyces sp.]|nr:hypothetical protein [Planctomyces sp.]